MITAIKGMNDVRPGAQEPFLDSAIWAKLFATVQEVMGTYAYHPVWLPLVESTELFTHGIGTQTDIVSKEMYSFTDRGNRTMSLRPEGTAGAVRAYIEHHLARHDSIQRWFYAGPMFRAERPQKGRYRQFYQVGAEFFGVADPAADVEVVLLVRALCEKLGLPNTKLKLNTLGDAQSRHQYREALTGFLKKHQEALCASCVTRAEQNPLRVLDCKNPKCQAVLVAAPDMLASLTPEAGAWFDRYLKLLDRQNVPYTRDSRLVRGLDYYAHAIFEMTTDGLGAQDSILGGGRYDGLVEQLGGPATPAVGFGAGVERLALLMAQNAIPARGPELYVALHSENALDEALTLVSTLRHTHGVRVELDTSVGRVKQALRRADKQGSAVVMVLGTSELEGRNATLKRLSDGHTVPCALEPSALHRALGTL
jgi:histidyl-tRNA synthetase